MFTDMGGLTSFLRGIPAGRIVSVTTVDDPFAYWRGKAKKAVNFSKDRAARSFRGMSIIVHLAPSWEAP